MDLTALQTALKRFGFDDSDPLTIWLNAGMHEFVRAASWPFLEALASVAAPTAANQVSGLPTNMKRVISIQLQDSVSSEFKLKFWRWHKYLREIDDYTVTGKPEIYSIYKQADIYVYPRANASYTLDVYHTIRVPDLSDPSDTPGNGTIPDDCHYPIVQKAAGIALQAENEEDRAATAHDAADMAFGNLMIDYGVTHEDEFEQVQDVMGYGQ